MQRFVIITLCARIRELDNKRVKLGRIRSDLRTNRPLNQGDTRTGRAQTLLVSDSHHLPHVASATGDSLSRVLLAFIDNPQEAVVVNAAKDVQNAWIVDVFFATGGIGLVEFDAHELRERGDLFQRVVVVVVGRSGDLRSVWSLAAGEVASIQQQPELGMT